MEIGLVFAILSALTFGIGVTFTRRGVAGTGESLTAVFISIIVGLFFFLIAIFLNGDWRGLDSLSGWGIILLAAAGLIHFVAGRLLGYNAYRLIGATKSAVLSRTAPFYTVILGGLFLEESITFYLGLGILLTFAGTALAAMEKRTVSEDGGIKATGTEAKGIIAALGSGLCWGISPVLIKAAATEGVSPSAAAFVSYAAASIAIALFLFQGPCRGQLRRLRSTSLIILIIAGILVAFAQLFRYMALDYSEASRVTPIVTSSVFFIFIFSFIINRKIELFTPKVILGMVAMLIGGFFIVY